MESARRGGQRSGLLDQGGKRKAHRRPRADIGTGGVSHTDSKSGGESGAPAEDSEKEALDCVRLGDRWKQNDAGNADARC